MARQRIGWVDATKGFAIICIILGHFSAFFMDYLDFAKALFLITGSFHVPLFFLLSGYTMSPDKRMGAAGVRKLAKRCFLPYVFAGIASIVMCLVFVDPARLHDFVFGFFYGAGAYRDNILFGDTSHVNAIGLIWFLPALFVGKILASSMHRLSMGTRLGLSAALFLVAAATAPMLFLPFDVQQGMCACWWITCGMWLRKENAFSSLASLDVKARFAATGIMGTIYVCAVVAGAVSVPMYCNSTYHAPFFDMLCTSCACVSCIFAVKWMSENVYVLERALTWCGLHSIAIFVFHAITLAPGDEVKWWAHGLVDGGADPVAVFFVLLSINAAIVFGATALSRHVRPLRWILYGGSAPVMPETSVLPKKSFDGALRQQLRTR